MKHNESVDHGRKTTKHYLIDCSELQAPFVRTVLLLEGKANRHHQVYSSVCLKRRSLPPAVGALLGFQTL